MNFTENKITNASGLIRNVSGTGWRIWTLRW